jgi:hypothetical protein
VGVAGAVTPEPLPAADWSNAEVGARPEKLDAVIAPAEASDQNDVPEGATRLPVPPAAE